MCSLPAEIKTFAMPDGYKCAYRHYSPTGEPKATLVFLHGIQSHGGWYTRSCEKLAEAGYEVYFLDRRGCGLNTVDRAGAISFRLMLDEIAAFIRAVKPTNRKLFLCGISWGGKMATSFPFRHPGLIDGLILFCPGLASLVKMSLLDRVRITIAAVVNKKRLFDVPLNDPAMFTASPEWQEFIRNDEKALRKAQARLLFQSVRFDIYLIRAWKGVTMPVLMFLAEHEQIINNTKVRKFVEKFPTTDRTIIEYPGTHHTLEFEPEPQPFLADLLAWLEKHK